MPEKKGRDPITPIRFTDADKILMREIIDHHNNDLECYPKFNVPDLLRYLIRKEHKRIFS